MKFRYKKTLLRATVVSAAIAGAGLAIAPMAMAVGALSGTAFIVDPATNQNMDSGGSQTQFAVKVPAGAACTGDSNNGYSITGYVTDQSDPQNLTFSADGPAGTGTSYPLIDATHGTYVGRPVAPGTGAVLPTGPLTWSDFDTSSLPPGTYHIGLACVKAAGGFTMDKFWDTKIQFIADGSDAGGFRWQTDPKPQIPEVPMAILLPVSAGLLAAGGAFVLHRRRRDEATTTLAA